MKSRPVPGHIAVLAIAGTVLLFVIGFWIKDQAERRDLAAEIMSLPFRVIRFFRPPPPRPPARMVVANPYPDHLAFPPAMRSFVEEFYRQQAPADPNLELIYVTRARLAAIPKRYKADFEEFMRQKGRAAGPHPLPFPDSPGQPALPPEALPGPSDRSADRRGDIRETNSR